MDIMKDGGSTNKPPILDGTNYDYWKVIMVVFIKFMGNKVWKVVIKEWKHLVITSKDGTTSLKPEVEWIGAEDKEALGNSKDLNDIFIGMDKNMFRLINTYSVAKEA